MGECDDGMLVVVRSGNDRVDGERFFGEIGVGYLCMLGHNGNNVVESAHAVHHEILSLSYSIRRGQTRGIGGHTMRNMLVMGRGVIFAAVEFVYMALRR